MRIDNQQQQNKGVMDLMPQTGAVEEKTEFRCLRMR